MTEKALARTLAAARPRRPCLRLALLLTLVAAPAAAQYRAAGSDLDVFLNTKKQLEKSMAEAPWNIGAVRVAPWVGLRDVAYVRELDASGERQKGDLTITAGAGLKGYLPLGKNAIAAAHVMPEYAWWQRQDQRNAVVGRYGLGLFGWYNRLHGELTARSSKTVDFLSSDVLVREPTQSVLFEGKAQMRIVSSIALFASGTQSRVRVDSTSGATTLDPALLLDRDSQTIRGGLRYLLRGERGYVGAGALAEKTDFDAADGARSNKGSSWYAEAFLRGNNLDVTVQYDQRDLEPADSTFPGYRAANGNASIMLHPGWRIQYQLYALRQLRYSARQLSTFTEEERSGVAIKLAIGRGGIQIYYERGDDDYFGATTLHESVTGRGGWIDFALFKHLQLRVGGRETKFEPDVGAPRELKEVTGALSLTLGQPGEW